MDPTDMNLLQAECWRSGLTVSLAMVQPGTWTAGVFQLPVQVVAETRAGALRALADRFERMEG